MAKIKFNSIVDEVSGAFGNVVFRAVRGKTIMARKATASGNEASAEQEAHRERFREAVAYGKSAMADADLRALYDAAAEGRDVPVFALTVADFFNAPVIHNVDIAAYEGKVGDVIKVRASDDFGVKSVSVVITDGQGAALENGAAVETAAGSNLWVYTAKTTISETSVVINVVATDHPGGVASALSSKSV